MELEKLDLLSYTYPKSKNRKEYSAFITKKHLKDKSLVVESYENAYVVSDAPFNGCYQGCVLDSNMNPVNSSFHRDFHYGSAALHPRR